jgi:hypothetical protein
MFLGLLHEWGQQHGPAIFWMFWDTATPSEV